MTAKTALDVGIRYQQKLAAVGRLAGGIAHEINTPIQFVNDNLVFLGESMGQILHLCEVYRRMCEKAVIAQLSSEDTAQISAAEQEADFDFVSSNIPKSIESALDGSNRVAAIAQSLGAFAHPFHEQLVHADINAVLRETLTIARNEIKYVATVETRFGDLPTVPCMVSDLKHVFLVLVNGTVRAIENARGRGAAAVVGLETFHDAGQVVVVLGHREVAAPLGGALDPAAIDVVRSIIEEHRGSLTFESLDGPGERAIVRLPTARPVSTPCEA
jgi:two-component system, NtrC family, sensor kinase